LDLLAMDWVLHCFYGCSLYYLDLFGFACYGLVLLGFYWFFYWICLDVVAMAWLSFVVIALSLY